MKKILTAILTMMIVSAAVIPAGAEEWDRVDKAAFAAYTACQFGDYLQTRKIIGSGDIELNPVLSALANQMGKTGVTLYFAGSTALSYLLSDTIFKNHKKMFLGIILGGSAQTVYWNLRMGYRW